MHRITKREQQIIEHIVKGLSTAEIGRKLFISEHTVFSHKQNLFKKLNVNNSVSLAMKAYINSLVDKNEVVQYYTATHYQGTGSKDMAI